MSPDVLAAPAPSINGSGAGVILNAFDSETLRWYQSLKADAEEIFYMLFGLDFVYLVSQWLIGGKDVHEVFTSFIKKMMSFAFFYTLLLNGHKLIGWVENGFQQSAIQATGASGGLLSWIFGTASKVFMACLVGPRIPDKSTGALESIWQTITGGPTVLLSDVLGMLVGLVVGIIALLAMIYLALEYIAIQLEAAMVASVGIILMGFAGSRWTVQHAEGYLKYALSVGVRFLVILLWIGFLQKSAGTVITQILSQVNSNHPTANLSGAIVAYGEVLIFVLLIAWMTKKLPSIASSIMSGASSLSGGAEGTAFLAGVALAGGAALMGGAALAGRGGAGALTGAQAANMGGAAGELKGAGGGGPFPGGGGGIAGGLSGSGGGGVRDMEDFPGAENAVPAPDPGTLKAKRQDAGFVLPPSNWGASPSASPKPAPGSSASSPLRGAAILRGAALAGRSPAPAGSNTMDSGPAGGTPAGATPAPGDAVATDTGAESGPAQVTQGAGGSDDLGTDVGASRVTESAKPASGGGTSASQETPTTSATPSAGQQAPTPQEALRAALQQSIQQAFAPMQESLGKLNETLAAGQQENQSDGSFKKIFKDYKETSDLAERFLFPGSPENQGVQAANHGLKHSE
ncbi:P-type conjugative transfer protein TrbL [Acidithiobacillus caldus]|uniref:P-type conjugative transfer protein TrbL n=1 Tax=Acidithiobacillus caldus TaxID=33059 RepID=UPI0029C05AC9|nr:P-type conjugative transfer protein TrbL [Acidithiobacillus caldus]